jgi:hypothetical protein
MERVKVLELQICSLTVANNIWQHIIVAREKLFISDVMM